MDDHFFLSLRQIYSFKFGKILPQQSTKFYQRHFTPCLLFCPQANATGQAK